MNSCWPRVSYSFKPPRMGRGNVYRQFSLLFVGIEFVSQEGLCMNMIARTAIIKYAFDAYYLYYLHKAILFNFIALLVILMPFSLFP